MSDFGAPELSLRRVLPGLVVALLVGVLVVVAFGRLTGFGDIGDAFDGATWQWLAICFAGQILVFAGYAGAFRSAVTMDDGPVVETRTSLRIVLASFGMTQLVAAGGAAGLAITYWALRKFGFARRDAAVRLIGLNTAVYLVFALIAWTGALVALVRGSAPLGMVLAWICAVPVVIVVARWFTDAERVESWTRDSDGRIRNALGTGVSAAAWVRRAVSDAKSREIFSWAAVYWLGDLLSLWAALRAFDADPGLGALTVAYATGYLAQAIPVPFIATGGVDAATTLVLTAVGVPVEVALLGVVAHRVFAFWLPIGPGVWSAARLVRDARRNEAAAHGISG